MARTIDTTAGRRHSTVHDDRAPAVSVCQPCEGGTHQAVVPEVEGEITRGLELHRPGRDMVTNRYSGLTDVP